jgi:AraC-like DNA-binding protein
MTEESRRVVAAALAVMAARFRERLPLHELAAEVGVSPSHLCRIFRTATTVTVHQHLVKLRVSASVDAVRRGAALTPLAFDLGFASHSHFTAAFRRVHGLPPSRYRSMGTGALSGTLSVSNDASA